MYQFDRSNTKIFDLGGVIINIDPPKTFRLLESMVANQDELPQIRKDTEELWITYEKGECNFESLPNFLNPRFNEPLSVAEFRDVWNGLLLDIPEHRINALMQWKEREPLYLLSNTNEEHIIRINKYLNETYGIAGLEEIFEDLFLSYELHMRKPDADIYKYTLETLNIAPEKLVFFDDVDENISGSRAAGLPAEWVPAAHNDTFWNYLSRH